MLSDVAINAVNAPYIAKERGIKVTVSKVSVHTDYSSLVEVVLQFKDQEQVVAGSIFGKSHPRLVRFNNTYIEVDPKEQILIVKNKDIPGVVGRVGTFLGSKNVNISNMQLGLEEETQMATTFYSVTGDVTKETLDGIRDLDGILSVNLVKL